MDSETLGHPCRDMPTDRVSELFIVIRNSEWQNRSHVLKPATTPRLQATNIACRGWMVEADFTYVFLWKRSVSSAV